MGDLRLAQVSDVSDALTLDFDLDRQSGRLGFAAPSNSSYVRHLVLAELSRVLEFRA
jgi:hypothetical protein